MTVYIGVDFHARQQTICFLTTEDGEIRKARLEHEGDNVRKFYEGFSGKVIVGLEASAYNEWFEEKLLEMGIEVWVGNAAEIRRRAPRRQKNDERDAELILTLMIRGDFPRIHRHEVNSRVVLRQLRYRHQLVRVRTICKNSLQWMALSSGGYFGKRIYSKSGRKQLAELNLKSEVRQQAEYLVEMVDELSKEIDRIETWMDKQARADQRVIRLRTHPGIGLLTSLALVNRLCPVDRFSNSKKVTAYFGMDPVEDSSAGRVRIGSISKQGSKLARFLLIEAATVAVRRDPDLKRFYLHLAGSRGKAKAIVAAGRKLLTRCFIMLRDEIDYAEFVRRGVEVRSSRDSQ